MASCSASETRTLSASVLKIRRHQSVESHSDSIIERSFA